MIRLRLAWILGFLSTRDYDLRMREKTLGTGAIEATGDALRRLEGALNQDRLAVIVFLIGAIILAYTILNAPGTA
jgi:hypothetical protein